MSDEETEKRPPNELDVEGELGDDTTRERIARCESETEASGGGGSEEGNAIPAMGWWTVAVVGRTDLPDGERPIAAARVDDAVGAVDCDTSALGTVRCEGKRSTDVRRDEFGWSGNEVGADDLCLSRNCPLDDCVNGAARVELECTLVRVETEPDGIAALGLASRGLPRTSTHSESGRA